MVQGPDRRGRHDGRARGARDVGPRGPVNIPFLFPWVDWDAEAPPFGLLLVNLVIGVVSVVGVVLAWNAGNRKAIRINVVALILDALMVLPGLFVDASPFIKSTSALTLAAVVLTRRRDQTLARVTDWPGGRRQPRSFAENSASSEVLAPGSARCGYQRLTRRTQPLLVREARLLRTARTGQDQ